MNSLIPIQLAAPLSTRVFYLWLFGATAVGAFLRCYNLASPSLWMDELNTVRSSAIFGDRPPLYKPKVLGYMPMSLSLAAQGIPPGSVPADEPEKWRAMGITEIPMRISSVVVGILSVPILALVSRGVIGARAACMLALLLAVAPWHLSWSRDARFYSLQFLFYNLSLMLYFVATRERSRSRMVLAMVLMVLAFLTQPPALVIVGVFAADWLLGLLSNEPARLGRYGWTCAIVALALCAASLTSSVAERPTDWASAVTPAGMTPRLVVLGVGYLVGPAVMAIAVVAGWWLARSHRRLAVYLLLAAILPPLIYACVALRGFVMLRYVFVCLFAWLALAAIGADQLYLILRPRIGRVAAILPLALIMLGMMLINYGYHTSGAGFHTRWRDAFTYISRHRQPGEAVRAFELMGRYYLEDGSVRFVPPTAEDLTAPGAPTWVVLRTDNAALRRRYGFLDKLAELRREFPLQVVQPRKTLSVWRYDPQAVLTGRR